MAGPAPWPVEIYQGDSFELPVRLRSVAADGTLGDYIDLTGSTLKAQVRDTTDATVRAEFGVDVADQTAVDGKGVATLSLTHVQTEALPPDASSRWDLQITYADGKVKTLLAGPVTIAGEITE